VSESRSLDLTRLTTADRVLLGAATALFVDSLLTWQRACATVAGVDACERAYAWAGHGAIFGALMALSALAICLVLLAAAGGLAFAPFGVPGAALLAGMALVAGLIKLLLIAGRFPSYGAWIGLILLGAVASGALMKVAERSPAQPRG
jgi:hypothetical protein